MAGLDIGSALNYQFVNLINITPFGATPTWSYLAEGIETITPNPEEKVDETEDYSTGGNTRNTVTGVNMSYDFEGTRRIGNEAQEYIASLQDDFGDARTTQRRLVHPTGLIVEEDVTIRDINMGGPNGEASGKQAISFSMARNDTPRIIQAAKGTKLPETITVEAVTVAVDGTTTVAPTVTPTTASNWCVYAIKDEEVAKVTADGIITGLKAGETTLSVRCASKPSVRATVKVTVTSE